MPIGTLRRVDLRRVVRLSLASLWRIYLMLILVALLGQRWLIYPVPRDVIEPRSPGLELLTIESDEGRLVHAFHLPAKGSQRTLVMFHGNGEQLADTVPIAEEYVRQGLSVFAVEYPGYGLSKGEPTNERSIYSDAERAMAYLESKKGVSRAQTVILGQSLGSAVAAEMAARGHGARLVLISPFTSMIDMASLTAPILPTRWIVCDKFDTLSKAPGIKLPTLLVHGTADTVVPTAMGLMLSKRLPKVTLKLVVGAEHNDIYDVGGDELLSQIAAFAQSP